MNIHLTARAFKNITRSGGRHIGLHDCEMLEETSYVVETLEDSVTIPPAISYFTEKIELYVARGLNFKDCLLHWNKINLIVTQENAF